MKRNLDLIRHILLTTESSNLDNLYIDNYVNDLFSAKEVSYHISLLCDDNYLIATTISRIGNLYPEFIVKRLTNSGCDFLDSIRDDNIFNQTKTKIFSTVGSTTLDIIKDVALSIIRSQLGI